MPPSPYDPTRPSPHAAPQVGHRPAYGAPAPAHVARVAPPPSQRWLAPLIVGVSALIVLAFGTPYLVTYMAIRPSAVEERTERAFLDNAKLPACRAPDACTETHEDHGVSFPICTSRAPALSPHQQGDMIVAKHDGVSRIAMVEVRFPDDRYAVTWLTSGSKKERIPGSAVVGRLCGVHAKRPAHLD